MATHRSHTEATPCPSTVQPHHSSTHGHINQPLARTVVQEPQSFRLRTYILITSRAITDLNSPNCLLIYGNWQHCSKLDRQSITKESVGPKYLFSLIRKPVLLNNRDAEKGWQVLPLPAVLATLQLLSYCIQHSNVHLYLTMPGDSLR